VSKRRASTCRRRASTPSSTNRRSNLQAQCKE
jgi:hypothetical protein